ncbi:AraC family transcriptional regulator [Aquimarina sp. AU474]|uniref:AraC family transcriptional regulator n=1 Tax=Aquimarina sp. AU474 TaxID=2108529 RepID=UPI000D690DDB|nr:AraC family transcriptional regulator [Aquimarina sp. AU474]
MRFIFSFLIILLVSNTSIFSYDKIDSTNNNKYYKNISKVQDSLLTKTYQELSDAYNNIQYKDSIKARIYINYYLKKAKTHQDSVRLADAYYMLLGQSLNNLPVALSYCDSILDFTKHIKHKYYPARGYIGKGIILSKSKKYNEALEFYLLALQYAEANQNIGHIIACKHNIAILKNTLGKSKEALIIYQSNLKAIKKQDTAQYLNYYITTCYQLGDSYNRLEVLDSAQFYFKKGIAKSLSSSSKYLYPNLLSGYGINSYLKEDYTVAIDSITKSLELLSENPNNSNYRINQLFLAKTYLKLNKPHKAFSYLKEIDTFIKESNYSNLLRDTFVLLIEYYKANDDQDQQLETMEKLLKYDRISKQKEKILNTNIIKNYDTAQLIKDKDELIIGIQTKSKKLQYRFLIIAVLIIGLITFFYFYYFKKEKKVYEEKYADLLHKFVKRKKSTKQIEIAPEIIENIIYRLNKFEEDQEFLKNDLTMAKVAKKFKTNSSYLSKVINTRKKQNFANYLNDLRIDFCIEKIKTDKKFRRYSIKSIAQESGFNNIQSFSAAFQKRIHQNPSDYIQKIEYSKNP